MKAIAGLIAEKKEMFSRNERMVEAVKAEN